MYVADLVALPAERGKGYGKALFAWLEDEARRAGAKRCARHGAQTLCPAGHLHTIRCPTGHFPSPYDSCLHAGSC
jgi:GNAT superfamily N-acetyltransferase